MIHLRSNNETRTIVWHTCDMSVAVNRNNKEYKSPAYSRQDNREKSP